MSIKEDLNLYITKFKLIYQYTTGPDNIIIIDLNFVIYYYNSNNLINIDRMGQSIFDIALFADNHDGLIQHANQYLYCEFILPHNNQLYKIRLNKIKIKNNTIGWVLFLTRYNEENIFFNLLQRTNFKMGIKSNKRPVNFNKLTQIQKVICYLIMYNLSNEAIAKLLNHLYRDTQDSKNHNLSKKYIERHIERLKEILQVHSKVEMIDLLISNNYYRQIPDVIMNGLLQHDNKTN